MIYFNLIFMLLFAVQLGIEYERGDVSFFTWVFTVLFSFQVLNASGAA